MEGQAGAAEPNEEGEDERGTVEDKIEDEDRDEYGGRREDIVS